MNELEKSGLLSCLFLLPCVFVALLATYSLGNTHGHIAGYIEATNECTRDIQGLLND